MTHYFISDLHFGHYNIIKHAKRPFKDVEEMNDHFYKMWNSTVKPTDTIICVGDITAMMDKAVDAAKVWLRLNGKKIVVSGNHDQKVLRKLSGAVLHAANITLVEPLYEHRIGKDMVVVCHYPIEYWNKRRYGIPHVHGHIHSNNPLTGSNRVDVGWDAWGRIPSWQDIKDIMEHDSNKVGEFKLYGKSKVDTHEAQASKKEDPGWRTP